jgi:hypothetical protein
MRHEKTVSVSKIKPLWEPWEEDETPRKYILDTSLEFKYSLANNVVAEALAL